MMNTVVIQAETQGTFVGCIMQTTPTPGPRWLGSIATTTAYSALKEGAKFLAELVIPVNTITLDPSQLSLIRFKFVSIRKKNCSDLIVFFVQFLGPTKTCHLMEVMLEDINCLLR